MPIDSKIEEWVIVSVDMSSILWDVPSMLLQLLASSLTKNDHGPHHYMIKIIRSLMALVQHSEDIYWWNPKFRILS